MTAAFSGNPKTIWIASPEDDDRKMELIDEFWFDDRSGHRWTTPAGYRVDGASIPRALWTLIGSPYTGQYRRASIVHDKACDDAVGHPDQRRAADRMFFEACRAGGCGLSEAAILYAGVRVGGTWSQIAPALTESVQLDGPRISQAPSERAIVAEFQYLADQLTRPGPTDDPLEIERRADEAEGRLNEFRAAGIPTIGA